MVKESLSLVHCQEVLKVVPIRESGRVNLDNQFGYKLTGLSIIRPAQGFVFGENRLRKVILDADLALQVTTLDPDRVIRQQFFQCNNPDTAIGLKFTSAKEEKFFTLEFDRNTPQKRHLLLVK